MGNKFEFEIIKGYGPENKKREPLQVFLSRDKVDLLEKVSCFSGFPQPEVLLKVTEDLRGGKDIVLKRIWVNEVGEPEKVSFENYGNVNRDDLEVLLLILFGCEPESIIPKRILWEMERNKNSVVLKAESASKNRVVCKSPPL